jgi:predicted RNA-binding Zn ribbon-like protein
MDNGESGRLAIRSARRGLIEEFIEPIKIPNVYTGNMTVSTIGRGHFAVVGEPVVAVDLINTVAAAGSATAKDLLSSDQDAELWWRIQGARVPGGDLPDIRALHRLRSALRETIEALVDRRLVPQAAVSDLNFFMQSAPVSTRLVLAGTGLRAEAHWHREYGGNPRLAFIAAQAGEFLADPSEVSRLRRCANPDCSMIFVAVNPRRSWCAPSVCGNRARVARHYRRAAGTTR